MKGIKQPRHSPLAQRLAGLIAALALSATVAALPPAANAAPQKAAAPQPPTAAPAQATPSAKAPAAQPPPAPPPPFVIELGDPPLPPWQIRTARPTSVDLDASGRRLVADRDANHVLLYGADGALLATIPLGAPVDADFLTDGHLLLTGARENTVIELDAKQQQVWEYRQLEGAREATRLANGHTLIADSNPPRVIEVDAAGAVVWSYARDLALPSAVRPYGTDSVLIADYNRHRVDCVRRDGSLCWRVNHIGHPSQLVVLDDGGFLVAAHKAGGILHVGANQLARSYWPIGRDLEDFAYAGDKLLVAVRPRVPIQPPERLQANASRVLASARRATPPSRPPALRALPGIDTRRRNVVLILFDSLRRDHLPWEGYWRRTAPRLASLQPRAVTFDQFITHAPWTKPSVASLLTSTYPGTHGAISQKPYSELPGTLITMAEALRDAGYFTAAVMENPHMGDRKTAKGFDQGYQRYAFLGSAKLLDQMPALMTDTAVEMLRERPADRPFFLTMFFMNPHYPYQPRGLLFGDEEAGPGNPGSQNSYDAEIREADSAVGRLLDELARLEVDDETIVVFSSDHGEEFQDHDKRFHGDTLFDCVLNPPLLIAGLDRAGRFPGLVRQIDLLPTLLDYLGVTAPPPLADQIAGVSVRPFIERGATSTGLVAFSQTRFRPGMRMVSERSETRKVIADVAKREIQIYDLEQDPQEYNNLATPEMQRAELRRLVQWEKSLRKVRELGTKREPIPESVLERLRQAGYLTESQNQH